MDFFPFLILPGPGSTTGPGSHCIVLYCIGCNSFCNMCCIGSSIGCNSFCNVWVANDSRATVGQSQSGESGKSSNPIQSGTLQSGNQAQSGQSGKSPNRSSRAVGQSGKSGNRANRINASIIPLHATGTDCVLCQTGQTAQLARLRERQFTRLASRQIGARFVFPVEPVGQSSASLPDCH